MNGEAAGTEASPRLEWRRSSYSNNGGNCVEVASNLPGVIGVRDSKNPMGSVVRLAPGEWSVFVASIKRGDCDI